MSVPDDGGVDPVLVPLERPGALGGPLASARFVAKDLFDVAGTVTGAGNPTWAAEATPAADDAPAVRAWLDAGATLVGKALTDELAYSLAGTNVHHGTPANPAAPGRIPGGSSVGSVVSVASGRCELALGTDTGGSVRVPASYCGTWGMRPTHGRIPTDGLVALAPSLDTVGWFGADAALLAAGGRVLLAAGERGSATAVRRFVVVDELLALADPGAAASVRAAAEAAAAAAGVPCERVDGAKLAGWWTDDPASSWLDAFRAIQGAEAWAIHGEFVSRGVPMGEGVRGRFLAGRDVTVGELARAVAVREEARRRLEALCADGTVLAIPAAPGAAPPLGTDRAAMADVRRRTLTLTCGPGLAGLPVVSAPLAHDGGLPVGVCLVGAPWSDEALLDLAVAVGPAAG